MSIMARRMQRSIASSKPHYPTTSLINYGLSMAGPEMGHAAATVPGTLGTNYTYSPLQWYQYACANGLKHFRIPFLAERAEVRLSELMDHVASVLAIDTSVTVTLDMHNYGEKFISGVTQQLGTGWSNAAFAAEWVTIASHATVKNNPRVSFDLMNEANNYIGYATERAEAAALEASEQAAVTALRNAGITNVLKVQPYNWGAARRVADLHPSWWINDPLNRTIVSAHFYFDYSGAYVKSYADQESDARLAGYPSLESQVSSELAPFITWVNSQTALPAAELGEVGWPVQNEWCALADKTLDQLEASVKPIGWTYWGMNHWWDPGGEGNMMLFTFSGPDTPLNGRLLQADVLDIHLNRSIPKTVTATAPTYSTTSYTIPISFGVNYKCDGTTKLPGTYTASGTVTITAESKSAKFTMTGTTTWTGTLSASTVTTNLVQNPRAVSTGASMFYTNIAWSSTTKQWLTGQTGWANNTSTALAYTSAAANASSGNLISFITQDSASLTGYATGATVPVTIQGSRSQGGSLQLCMSWLDSNGLEISEDMPSAVTVAAGEKRTLTHNATKPSGAVRFDLQMRAPSAKAGEQVAATNFCVGSSTYFDGSTPDTASMTYAWTGTADASTSTRTETSGTLPTQPELFFDSNFAVNGVMGIYPDPNPDNLIAGGMTVYAEGTAPAALDTWLTYDPKNPSRVVCCCDSRNYKDTGNGYPRSELTTGQTLIPGQEYWEAFSWLSTNKLGWDDWNALITAAFGPPWDGPSPTSLADQPSNTPGKNWLRFSRTPAEGGITWSGEELTIGEWVQCIIHLRLDKSPNGWIEMWLNTGPGPNSFRKVLPLQAVGTITPGNTGNCYSSIGAYGVYPHKIYIGHHQVATAAQGKQALYFEDYGLGFDPALLP